MIIHMFLLQMFLGMKFNIPHHIVDVFFFTSLIDD